MIKDIMISFMVFTDFFYDKNQAVREQTSVYGNINKY